MKIHDNCLLVRVLTFCHDTGMSTQARRKPGPPKKPAIRGRDICGTKYLRKLRKRLLALRRHRDCANRLLHYDEYVGYTLLHFFNPILGSVRALHQASRLKKVQCQLHLPPFSLGAFSEAGRTFDPALLEPILAGLVAEARDLGLDRRLSALERVPTAVDGTLVHALARMSWALWRGNGEHAAKIHLEYEILKGVPVRATVTEANASEGRTLRSQLTAGKLYILDRGYADYALLDAILDAHSSFVVRVDGNAAYEVIEERPLSEAARKAGIERDLIVRLGSKGAPELHDRKIRLVQIHVRDTDALLGRPRKSRVDAKTKSLRTHGGDYTLLLATDLLDLDAEIIGDIYRYRWQVELFFRWFKCILHADHLISQSQRGLTIVTYCALIASVLLTLWTRRKPTKRTLEMLYLYFAGWADEEELEAYLTKRQPANA